VYSYTDDEEFTFMYNAVDIDGCGNISYSEFLAATIEAHGFIEEVRIAEAFDRLDSDDSGYITVNNLTAFLGKDIPESFIHKIIEEADVVDHDGQIDYDEFLGLWGSFDEDTLKRTILSVREKRLVRESAMELPPCDVNDTDDNDDDNDNDDGGEESRELLGTDIDHDEIDGAGSSGRQPNNEKEAKFYFQEEKVKSMRGAWV